ncbi:MAG TPA: endonuclease/exonuclease/phosphatase family protein [Steroidobacteraceae bacterium]|nr:endonuclease/exonuclease/phosphatase family protein [Steroidobacteraceae bacterium]
MQHVVAVLLLAAAGIAPAAASPPPSETRPADVIRIATFNCSLNRPTLGGLRASLSTRDDAQARAVAEIVQRVRPDILLLQEFDYDAAGESMREFQSNYLGVAQGGQAPLTFAHTFSAESNTGVPSGFDFDHDGKIGGGGDALGFGEFPGQYGMALFSRFPIDARHARTFRKFLWRDMPGALLPDRLETPLPFDWYSPAELAVLPLSSKSHWDVRVRIGARTLHVLASHPTPPAFDGPEDRNGLRNHDEIRFWSDYLSGATYIRDDAGKAGAFDGGSFVIMGDQNSDPQDGGSRNDAIRALLANPRVNSSFVPRSAGASEAALEQGGANITQRGPPQTDTADFNDRVAGNLRVDYLLPSKDLRVCAGGVFWPAKTDPEARLVWGDSPPPSSDHRLVWIDVTSATGRCPPGSDPTASAPSHPRR